jgi:hypothetical protein
MENQQQNGSDGGGSEQRKMTHTSQFANKLSAAGWGLLFIWLGTALLLNLRSSIILLGIGTVILLVQVISKYLNLRIRIVYVAVGLLFMMAGFWHNYKPDFPLIPAFLIIVGTALLLSFIKHIIT